MIKVYCSCCGTKHIINKSKKCCGSSLHMEEGLSCIDVSKMKTFLIVGKIPNGMNTVIVGLEATNKMMALRLFEKSRYYVPGLNYKVELRPWAEIFGPNITSEVYNL